MWRKLLLQISQHNKLNSRFLQNFSFSLEKTLSLSLLSYNNDDPLYKDLPNQCTDKSERKPYPTPMKDLIKRAKQERELRKLRPCRLLEHPPDNGLLVPELVDVAHHVYLAHQSLLSGLCKLVQVFPVQCCRFCSEVHIGNNGHEIRTCTGPKSSFRSGTHVWRKGGVADVVFFPKCFHLLDRVGKPRVVHEERHSVRRIPAILELCIQAGVDIEKYPVKRRTKPVYSIEGRIVDFDSVARVNERESSLFPNNFVGSKVCELARDLDSKLNVEENKLTALSVRTMDSWLEMIAGVKKIMQKYSVWTCGYCPEVQVGPKGHKVRMCKASKHQSRNGLHAWQEATIDDIVGPNYVWHVQDLNGPCLHNNLKRYYGKAPALVELCVQAGAPVPDQYRSMMRLDVVPPGRDEVDLVA